MFNLVQLLVALSIGILFFVLLFVASKDFRKGRRLTVSVGNIAFYMQTFNFSSVLSKYLMTNGRGCAEQSFDAHMIIKLPDNLLFDREGTIV